MKMIYFGFKLDIVKHYRWFWLFLDDKIPNTDFPEQFNFDIVS
jgi:hypothetical protein